MKPKKESMKWPKSQPSDDGMSSGDSETSSGGTASGSTAAQKSPHNPAWPQAMLLVGLRGFA